MVDRIPDGVASEVGELWEGLRCLLMCLKRGIIEGMVELVSGQ
jgi:hypothetical protein